MDVRLRTLPFTYGGRKYRLCCNMNVLADLQESGGLEPLLDANRSFRSYIRLLTAMLNEAADAEGTDLHATEREVGRKVRWAQFRQTSADVFGLLTAAIEAPDDEAEEEPGGEASKNAETSEAAATA